MSIKTTSIVRTSIFLALTAIATLIIQIPSPIGGYLHAGDAIVLLCAFVLGPVSGAIAAGVGSALADIISGYAIYAPATLIIKALMALVAGKFFQISTNHNKIISAIIAGILAEAIMIVGYFLYEAFILGFHEGAYVSIPGNSIQAIFGIVSGIILFEAIKKIPQINIANQNS